MQGFREGTRMVEKMVGPRLPLLASAPESHKETRSPSKGLWRPWGQGPGLALRAQQDVDK